MSDEADKWARIIRALPEPRHRGDFSYSTEVLHLTPEVIAKAAISRERDNRVVGLFVGLVAMLLGCGLFYLGVSGKVTWVAKAFGLTGELVDTSH
jgi:hypothetical protein